MNWKEQLRQLELKKEWDTAIELMQKAINDNPNDLDAYLSMNYLLMNLLVEEDYNRNKHDYYAELLKKYFLESNSKFSHNPGYLFYTGITAFMSEWYFELELEEARDMIREAYSMQTDNSLYKLWYYMGLYGDNKKKIIDIKREILANFIVKEELQSKGALGEYILGLIEYSSNKPA